MSNMSKFLRIICIWICCAFCLLERIQLPVVTAAIATPFEYFEDHDQLSYDLDTEQSKAKYDTRLLSEQMLKSEKSTEHYDESADSHVNVAVGGGGGGGNGMTNTELDDDNESETDADVDDLQPHERAASCHNNGHKYTHGQKVPRLDPCEVCLCMDGEIFCWWELCTKHPTAQIKSEYHSNSQQDTSTVRLNEMSSTLSTTAYPTADIIPLKQAERQQQQQQQRQQQYQHETPAYSSSLAQSATKHEHEHASDYNKNYQQQQQSKIASSTKSAKSWQKKKIYQEQQKQKYEQQQKPQHQHKHTHEHAHAEVQVGNTPYYVYPPSSGSKILSFPENLPSVLYHDYRTEEHQHHQHQHHQQHLKHQQKKLQMQLQQQQQKQQQKQKQEKKQKQQQYKQLHAHNAWQRGDHHQSRPQYQHDIFKAKSAATNSYAATPLLYAVGGGGGAGGGDSNNLGLNTDWGLVDGNENVYDDTETDSDILPEPPTKKPKMTAAAITITNTASAETTTNHDSNASIGHAAVESSGGEAQSSTSRNVAINGAVGAGVGAQATGLLQQQQQLLQQSDNIVVGNEKSFKMNTPDASSLLQQSSSVSLAATSSSSSSSSAAPAATYVVNMATSSSAMSTKIADKTAAERQQKHQDDIQNAESSEEDQDDAFHRWLTSTETNNNQNSSNADDTSNSFEEDSTATARRTNLFRLAGAHDINTTTTIAASSNQINGTSAQRRGEGSMTKNNRNTNKNNNKMDNLYFRSSYNDYSSEYNGSVVNIDILLTTADEQQQQQQQKADLITQPSSNSQQTTATITTTTTTAIASNLSSLALANNTTTTTLLNASTQTNSPERQCNVMGTLYKIGDVLPQDTGNCLQCVCIDGSTSDDTPRVTCSPHNCPPLVLPDLFDATGY